MWYRKSTANTRKYKNHHLSWQYGYQATRCHSIHRLCILRRTLEQSNARWHSCLSNPHRRPSCLSRNWKHDFDKLQDSNVYGGNWWFSSQYGFYCNLFAISSKSWIRICGWIFIFLRRWFWRLRKIKPWYSQTESVLKYKTQQLFRFWKLSLLKPAILVKLGLCIPSKRNYAMVLMDKIYLYKFRLSRIDWS